MKYFPIILATFLLACTSKQTPRNEKAELDSLGQHYWNRELRTGRAIKITGGKSPLPEKLYAGTREDFKDDSVYFSDLLQKLKTIDATKLPSSSLVDYDLLQWIAEMRLEATRYYDNVFPTVTPYASHLSSADLVFKQAAFDTEADVAQYLKLLDQYSEVQKSELAKLRSMEARGIRLAKPEIELTLGLIKTWQVEPTKHGYYPQSSRLQKLDSSLQKSFQEKALLILSQKVIPNHDSLAAYLSGSYRANASETVGLGQYPGGKEYYRFLVKWHTTTDLTPEAIHEIGKKQVASISKKLDSIRVATKFKGDMKAFYKFLQKDKRFLATTPDEVGERLKKPLRRMDTVIHRLISLKPEAGYDVRRLALALEPAMTFGNYLPPAGDEPLGIYYYNGSKLDQRPLTTAASLAFHEITPGHHWQMSLQSENKELSEFRQNTMVTAFAEGWGDYSAYLGIELGLFDDPYDYCGRLLMDMFISVRLVVDTGMNYLGWSREQAMDFMRANVIESEEQINTESIRYSCDIPAQALGYKIGSLKLIELRSKYQTALGKDFSVVKFHDAILRNGNLPLAVLEKSLDREFGVK
ncbi:MAG: DUF885 domain-containing protein [Cyclobacteriaceae bacterium]|nr:DUF885 domain-containing protein [Cyclobacteriaceae bacterium]